MGKTRFSIAIITVLFFKIVLIFLIKSEFSLAQNHLDYTSETFDLLLLMTNKIRSTKSVNVFLLGKLVSAPN